MKTLIISIYDSCWNYSVYPNKEEADVIDLYSKWEFDKVIEKYKPKYDVIIICDNGSIEIVKGEELLQ